MKKWVACLLFIVPFLLTASPIRVQTPPKLENFILKKIGTENFFQGKNTGVKTIKIAIKKDNLYYPFDLYKSVSMGTGVPFDVSHTTYYYRRGEQNYTLSLHLESAHNPVTHLKNSVVVLIFTSI